MSECDGKCSSCKSKGSCEKQYYELNELSSVKEVIAVVSGKGGVGKSLVTSLLAVEARRRGKQTAILDADITGPSIPNAFGIEERAEGMGEQLYPVATRTGIKVISANLLLENKTDPVIWRGPVISGMVKTFWSDVVWGDVDYMFVDMPPGTGDVPLTVFQSLPVSKIVIVTSPQELVSMIVAKAVNMAKKLNVPIAGIVENYSYLACPDCGKKIEVFGSSRIDEIAAELGVKVLAKLPIDPKLASLADGGKIEFADTEAIASVADKLGIEI